MVFNNGVHQRRASVTVLLIYIQASAEQQHSDDSLVPFLCRDVKRADPALVMSG